MTQRYAIINPSTLDVMNVVVWDGESIWKIPDGVQALLLPDTSPVQIGWRYIPITNSFLKNASSDPTAPIRRMEKIDFMRLFKTEELVRYKMLRMMINNLTTEDYMAAMSGDQQKLMLVQADVYFDRFDLASQVEMDHAETVMAIQMLASAGIFGTPGQMGVTTEYVADRVATVLAGLMPNAIPVDPEEPEEEPEVPEEDPEPEPEPEPEEEEGEGDPEDPPADPDPEGGE